MQSDNFQPMPVSLKYLAIVMVVIELLAQASQMGLLQAEDFRWLMIKHGGLWAVLIMEGWEPIYPGQQVLMFVTHALIHGSLLHMAMNVAVLVSIGKRLAMIIGSKWVLILFFVTAIAGGVLFVLFNKSGSPAVGASGAVFGFFGFWKLLEYRALRRMGASLMPIYQFIGAMVVLNVVLWFGLGGLLAWEAHLGGFLAGWALGLVFTSRGGQSRWTSGK